MARAAFIGLGVMGYPMAAYLARAGHEVTVYNRTAARAQAWVDEFGGRAVATPREASSAADFVFACVGNDDDLRAVTVAGDDGAFHGLQPGAVFIDHTTVSATLARELHAQARSRQAQFLDAPVSGGQAGAENGILTCMVGGDQEAFDRARPLLECYTRMLRLLGPAGSGQLAKMVNQICIAGLVEGLAEALHFAMASGQDGAAVLDVISKGAAQSWQMDNRGQTMLQGKFDFGFAVDWMRKDLAIVLDEARRLNIELPVTELVDRFYARVQELGGGRWDTSSLIVRLQHDQKADS